jgi:hypothetical protein
MSHKVSPLFAMTVRGMTCWAGSGLEANAPVEMKADARPNTTTAPRAIRRRWKVRWLTAGRTERLEWLRTVVAGKRRGSMVVAMGFPFRMRV